MKTKYYFPLALFLAISVLGVSLAYWQDTLKISTEIKTGTFYGVWSDPTQYRYWENEPKDVVLDEEIRYGVSQSDDTFHTYFLSVGNNVDWNGAYPGYKICIPAGIQWQGSVPAHIYDIQYSGVPNWLVITYVPIGDSGPFEDLQLHWGEEYFFYICLEVIENDADQILPQQLEVSDFEITFVLCQWNDPTQ